jgi:periplasmic divalent cation tolerance protein
MEEAEKIAMLMIKEKIAASVDYWPIKSCYNWENKLQCTTEAMLLITTFEKKIDSVTSLINENHTYSVPLIAGVDVRRINHAYKEWMTQVTE